MDDEKLRGNLQGSCRVVSLIFGLVFSPFWVSRKLTGRIVRKIKKKGIWSWPGRGLENKSSQGWYAAYDEAALVVFQYIGVQAARMTSISRVLGGGRWDGMGCMPNTTT